MSYPPNSPDGAGSPGHRYPSLYQPEPQYRPQQPAYPVQPEYTRAPASGGPASGGPVVGSASVYAPPNQLPAGAFATEPAVTHGPPMSGPPYEPARPGPWPPARRGRSVPLLAAAAVVLLIVGGVMTALYVTKNSQLGDTKQDVAAGEAKTKDLEQQLQKAKADLAAARQDLTGTQNAQKETQRQKQVISKCLTLLAEAGRAAARNDQEAYNKAAKEIDKACNEAEKYLD